MYNLNELNDKFIICPSNVKKQILDEMNQSNELYNITFLSLESFYSSITFEISNELLYFVMKEYNVSYDVANTYLSSLKDIYLVKNQVEDEKLKLLYELKTKLIEKKYIKQTNVLEYYNTKSFIVLGYGFIEKKYQLALDLLKNCEIKDSDINIKQNMDIHEFKTIEDEIVYVYIKIIQLLNQGIDINNIKISGVTNDYYFLMKKFAKMFKLPITIEKENSLYDTNIGKKFMKSLEEKNTTLFLEQSKTKNVAFYNAIVNVLNEFTFVKEYNDVYNIIKRELQNTYIDEVYTNDIKVIDLNSISNDENQYVFVMGINQGVIPHLLKDEDYITDSLKKKLGLSTTVEKNVAKKLEVINILSQIPNVTLSYALASTFSSLSQSTIVSEYNMKVIKNNEIDYLYSNEFNKYSLTAKLDDYIKYGNTDKELFKLVNTYKLDEYDTYDNKFKGINNELLRKQLNDTVKLSYSSLNVYNECKFKYYIERILKLNIYEDTFYTALGSTFHEVLEHAFKDDFDFETQYEKSKAEYFPNITKKDEALLRKLKEELKIIIETINDQMNSINYKQLLTEQKVETEIKVLDNCTIKFEGTIDKIIYKEYEGYIYAAVIDYKTGSIDPTLSDTKYGLNLQLPIYIYLTKKLDTSNFSKNKIEDVKVTGFYYQTILPNEGKAEDEDDYKNKKNKYRKLQGYTVGDLSQDIRFDENEENSEVVKSLNRKKDGSYYSSSKIINLFQIDQLEKLVNAYIKAGGEGILNGDFAINPKMIGNTNESCQYCKYQDLCFRKDSDISKHKKTSTSDLSFLEEYK